MKPLRPRLGAWVLVAGWVAFLLDRWLLPEGPPLTKVWLTIVAMPFLGVGTATLAGRRWATKAMPAVAATMGVWGIVALLGLSADMTSSRAWMWASLFAFALGSVTLLLTSLSLTRRPSGGLIAYLVAAVVVGGAGISQVMGCRDDLHASWCDPRYEQEERILHAAFSERRPLRLGHFGGPLSPASATFLFRTEPDPLTAVVPRSAVGTREANGEVHWVFGGDDAACGAVSRVLPDVGGWALTVTVDCRS